MEKLMDGNIQSLAFVGTGSLFIMSFMSNVFSEYIYLIFWQADWLGGGEGEGEQGSADEEEEEEERHIRQRVEEAGHAWGGEENPEKDHASPQVLHEAVSRAGSSFCVFSCLLLLLGCQRRYCLCWVWKEDKDHSQPLRPGDEEEQQERLLLDHLCTAECVLIVHQVYSNLCQLSVIVFPDPEIRFDWVFSFL